jgi:hypothetical protein
VVKSLCLARRDSNGGARFGDVVRSVNGWAIESFEFRDEVPDVFSQARPACRVVALRGEREVEYAISPE